MKKTIEEITKIKQEYYRLQSVLEELRENQKQDIIEYQNEFKNTQKQNPIHIEKIKDTEERIKVLKQQQNFYFNKIEVLENNLKAVFNFDLLLNILEKYQNKNIGIKTKEKINSEIKSAFEEITGAGVFVYYSIIEYYSIDNTFEFHFTFNNDIKLKIEIEKSKTTGAFYTREKENAKIENIENYIDEIKSDFDALQNEIKKLQEKIKKFNSKNVLKEYEIKNI